MHPLIHRTPTSSIRSTNEANQPKQPTQQTQPSMTNTTNDRNHPYNQTTHPPRHINQTWLTQHNTTQRSNTTSKALPLSPFNRTQLNTAHTATPQARRCHCHRSTGRPWYQHDRWRNQDAIIRLAEILNKPQHDSYEQTPRYHDYCPRHYTIYTTAFPPTQPKPKATRPERSVAARVRFPDKNMSEPQKS